MLVLFIFITRIMVINVRIDVIVGILNKHRRNNFMVKITIVGGIGLILIFNNLCVHFH